MNRTHRKRRRARIAVRLRKPTGRCCNRRSKRGRKAGLNLADTRSRGLNIKNVNRLRTTLAVVKANIRHNLREEMTQTSNYQGNKLVKYRS